MPASSPIATLSRASIVVALVVLPALCGSSSAFAQKPSTIQGLWQGAVSCGKLHLGYDLRLKATPSGDVFGVLESYSLPDDAKPLPPGSYRVSGHVGDGGALLLNPVEWIKQPAPNIIMSTLDGKVVDKTYAGSLKECRAGGNIFSVAKTGDNPDGPASHDNVPATSKAASDGTPASAASAASDSGGGFLAGFGNALKKGFGQMGDPVIVRGYILVSKTDISQNPMCLWDRKTKELTGNGVFGRVSMKQDGSPSFQTTRISILDCAKAEQNGLLVVTDYTDMSPESTPFRGKKGTPALGQTALTGLFKRTPYDGTPKTYYPRVAVTVTDWLTTPGCWIAKATIWQSPSQSTLVDSFNVCWPRGDDAAANRLVDGDALMGQIDKQTPDASSGNVRTAGPKPPLRGLPERYPTSVARGPYLEFLRALTFGTGWVDGAPTNLWLVNFAPN